MRRAKIKIRKRTKVKGMLKYMPRLLVHGASNVVDPHVREITPVRTRTSHPKNGLQIKQWQWHQEALPKLKHKHRKKHLSPPPSLHCK